MEQFEFEKRKVGSPYTVPQEFFNQMEERLMAQVANERPKKSISFFPLRLKYASAAAVIALLVGTASLIDYPSMTSDKYDDIAQYFEQLSADDQDSMMESYQDDIFINY